MKFLVAGGIWFWEGSGPFNRKDVALTFPFLEKRFDAADLKDAIGKVKERLKEMKKFYPSRRYKDYGIQVKLFMDGASEPFWQYNFAKGKADSANHTLPADPKMKEVHKILMQQAINFQEPRPEPFKGGLIRHRGPS